VAEPAPHTDEPISAPMTDEPISAPMTDEPISAPMADEPIWAADPPSPAPPSAEPHGAITTDDLPVFEPTDEEIEREYPEVAAARKLHKMLVARYGTGLATGGSESCASPAPSMRPDGPGGGPNSQSLTPSSHSDTDEAISGRAPASDPPHRDAARAPPENL
jgi:hypothetical protein